MLAGACVTPRSLRGLRTSPSCGRATFSLFIYQSVDIQAVYTLWLSRITPLWAFVGECLCGPVIFFLLSLYLDGGSLGSTATPCVTDKAHVCSEAGRQWQGGVAGPAATHKPGAPGYEPGHPSPSPPLLISITGDRG